MKWQFLLIMLLSYNALVGQARAEDRIDDVILFENGDTLRGRLESLDLSAGSASLAHASALDAVPLHLGGITAIRHRNGDVPASPHRLSTFTLAGNDLLIGRISAMADGVLTINHPTCGDVRIPRQAVQSIAVDNIAPWTADFSASSMGNWEIASDRTFPGEDLEFLEPQAARIGPKTRISCATPDLIMRTCEFRIRFPDGQLPTGQVLNLDISGEQNLALACSITADRDLRCSLHLSVPGRRTTERAERAASLASGNPLLRDDAEMVFSFEAKGRSLTLRCGGEEVIAFKIFELAPVQQIAIAVPGDHSLLIDRMRIDGVGRFYGDAGQNAATTLDRVVIAGGFCAAGRIQSIAAGHAICATAHGELRIPLAETVRMDFAGTENPPPGKGTRCHLPYRQRLTVATGSIRAAMFATDYAGIPLVIPLDAIIAWTKGDTDLAAALDLLLDAEEVPGGAGGDDGAMH